MQRKHVLMLARQYLVGDLDDQRVDLAVQPLARIIGVGRGLFQDGIGADHLARDQILANAEMLQRPLSLRSPELVGRDLDLAQAVGFLAEFGHSSRLCRASGTS